MTKGGEPAVVLAGSLCFCIGLVGVYFAWVDKLVGITASLSLLSRFTLSLLGFSCIQGLDQETTMLLLKSATE